MKILVIQTAFIGDLIMTTPIFRALKQIYPDGQIDALVIPQSKIILENNPFVNHIYSFDKKKGWHNKLISLIKIISILRKNKYDVAVSVQNSFTSSLIMLLSGIKRRIGNRRQKLTTDNVVIPKGLHIRKRVLHLLSPLSDKNFSSQTELYPGDERLEAAGKIIGKMPEKSVKIVVAPGSVRETKKWQPEYFARLLAILKTKNIEIMLIGSPQERELCEAIIKDSGTAGIHNFAGEMDLLSSAALIQQSDLIICNDSSPLHLANAVETDVFAFFGPTVKQFGCYPYRESDRIIEVELDCRPCGKHGANRCPLSHHNCMRMITPEYVAELVFEKFGL